MRLRPRRRPGRLSMHARVALLTAIGVMFAVAVVSLSGWYMMRKRMYENLDAQLQSDAQTAAQAETPDDALHDMYAADLPASDWRDEMDDLPAEAQRLLDADGPPPPIIVRFLDADGVPVSSTEGAEWLGSAHPLPILLSDNVVTVELADAGPGDLRFYRVATVAADDGAVQVARLVTGIEGVLEDLLFLVAYVGFLGALLSGVVGWGVARTGLRPLHRLTGAVEDVARTQDLHSVITVDGQDEIARLATAFNRMMTALNTAKAAQQQLVQDAGHELRTPLTSLRNNVELLTYAETQAESGRTLAAEDRARLLRDLGTQAEELTALTAELVELAMENTDPEPLVPLDLADVVHGAVTRARARWPGIVFAVTIAHAVMDGQPGGLARMVLNLLDNAAKWSPQGGVVEVRLRISPSGGRAVLTVADEGPGIGEPDRPKVFERFYRAAEARSMPGSGLGLAIVAQVVATHGGDAEAGASPSGGAELRVSLPVSGRQRQFLGKPATAS
ncbi:sensor histidine kinase [Glycomyces sp. MUSA5-2]|uniref:sensor histidine kinase n=1 Tax=Glycomyces sp. MUSA5-2 TaxID=2053002 RepID=UPI0030094055